MLLEKRHPPKNKRKSSRLKIAHYPVISLTGRCAMKSGIMRM
jgi:hypothetical protein